VSVATLKLKRPPATAPARPKRPAVRGGPRGPRPTLAEAQRARRAEAETQQPHAVEAESQRTRGDPFGRERPVQRTRSERSSPERSSRERSSSERPSSERSSSRQASSEHPSSKHPSSQHRAPQQPASQRPSSKHPWPDRSLAERRSPERSRPAQGVPNERRGAPERLPPAGHRAAPPFVPKPIERVERAPAATSHADGSLRLSKRMSALGIASRREADEWIARGWVRVDGRVVSELGARVVPGQHISVDAKARREQAGRVTVLLNKPVGYVSGQAEDGHQPAVVLVTPQNQWREDRSGTRFVREHLRSLVPAGRLDIDSVGLLVLTQDGRVARQLVGEDGEIEKEYLVRVARAAGAPLRADALELLRHGLALDDVALRPAQVEWVNADQLRFVLREGRKRQIRRMCEAVGLQVLGLKRVRIGAVALGDLPPGQWRYLRADEAFAPPAARSEPQAAARAEQPDQADHDQVDRDDVAEQARHDQDQHAGDQRDERADVQGEVHGRNAD
jgi:23S rRNA pseudouridine2604 synthase